VVEIVVAVVDFGFVKCVFVVAVFCSNELLKVMKGVHCLQGNSPQDQEGTQ
jgi:hypothetical protein